MTAKTAKTMKFACGSNPAIAKLTAAPRAA
jgi:hypothetical protein